MNVLVNITRQTLHKHTLYKPEDRSIHILYICLDKLTIYDGINYLPSPPPAHYHNCLYCLIEPYPQAISLHVRLFIYVCLRACVCVPVCTLSLAFPARGAHINTRGTNCGDICNWFHLNFENIFARIELRFLFDDIYPFI